MAASAASRPAENSGSQPVGTGAPAAPDVAGSVQGPVAGGDGDGPVNEIVVSGRSPSPTDPAEQLNVVSYQAVRAVDEALIQPVTNGYNRLLPRPIQLGVHNVINNLDEPIVFVNFLLQLKPGKAMETLGRFTVNSTIGLAGLIDVAKRKPFNLPRRANGLAGTLGYYGVGPGPYLFLPIIGATSLRDMLARPFDLMILPAIVPKPFADPKVSLAKGTISSLDARSESDQRLARIRESADPYLVQRQEYLARRKAEIEVLQGKRSSIYDPPYYLFPADRPASPSAPASGTAPSDDGKASDAAAAGQPAG